MSMRRRLCVPPVPKLPSGLVELMDGLAREVLKHNPDNIYEFCAQHMQTLLEIRDGHAPKSCMTLDQKISKALKMVRERAEQRRHANDESICLTKSNVDDKKIILSSSEISPVGKEILKSSENKSEKEANIVSDTEKTGQEVKNDIMSSEFKDSDINQKHPTAFAVKDINQDMEQNDINNQEALDITLTKDDITTQDSDDSVKNKNTNNSIENNLFEHKITSNENHADVTDSPSQTLIETETLITEIKDHTENKFNTELENLSQLQKDDNEYNNELPTEAVIEKSTNHETISKYDESENEVMPPNITNFNSDTKNETNKNGKALEGQEVASVESINLSNQLSNEKVLSDDAKNNSVEYTHANTEDIIQEDKKILAVILSVQSDTSHQNQESKFVLNDELAQKVTEVSVGSESAAESTDKTQNSSMDLETAAITIQKVFRSFLFKTKTASYDDPTTVDINLLTEDKVKDDNDALNMQLKDRRPLGISRMDTVLQTVNEEKSLSLSTDDSSTLSSAATIIQAHVRGFLARNKFNLNKTTSTNSCVDSDGPSIPSLEADSENRKSKTVLNIHIVPEGGHFISRDESIITSMDLSLDHSPPSSINLHPLGYDKSERRKQLKREDAIQSVSPPSNNSGKLSDDVDSVKELLDQESKNPDLQEATINNSASDTPNTGEGNIANKEQSKMENPDIGSDEMDVITPYVPIEEKGSHESDNESQLLHSGEFHDIVVPTNVSRCDTSVVREFQNVLVYFILWNN